MPYGLRNQPDDRDIEVVQRILNFNLGPDGWDISAMDDIARYLEDRGYPVADVDDPDQPWNKDDRHVEDVVRIMETLELGGWDSTAARKAWINAANQTRENCTHHCQQHPRG